MISKPTDNFKTIEIAIAEAFGLIEVFPFLGTIYQFVIHERRSHRLSRSPFLGVSLAIEDQTS